MIINLFFNRNEDSIKEVNLKYGAYCYSIAYNILEEQRDTDECVNDTWLRAWNSIPPQKPNCLKLFLGKITRNLAFDKYRYNNSMKRGNGELCAVLDEIDEFVKGTADVESEVEQTELVRKINEFLHSLPKREKDIFLQRYFYADTTGKIAEKHKLKESNVLMILSRIRGKLKKYLIKEGYYEERRFF